MGKKKGGKKDKGRQQESTGEGSDAPSASGKNDSKDKSDIQSLQKQFGDMELKDAGGKGRGGQGLQSEGQPHKGGQGRGQWPQGAGDQQKAQQRPGKHERRRQDQNLSHGQLPEGAYGGSQEKDAQQHSQKQGDGRQFPCDKSGDQRPQQGQGRGQWPQGGGEKQTQPQAGRGPQSQERGVQQYPQKQADGTQFPKGQGGGKRRQGADDKHVQGQHTQQGQLPQVGGGQQQPQSQGAWGQPQGQRPQGVGGQQKPQSQGAWGQPQGAWGQPQGQRPQGVGGQQKPQSQGAWGQPQGQRPQDGGGQHQSQSQGAFRPPPQEKGAQKQEGGSQFPQGQGRGQKRQGAGDEQHFQRDRVGQRPEGTASQGAGSQEASQSAWKSGQGKGRSEQRGQQEPQRQLSTSSSSSQGMPSQRQIPQQTSSSGNIQRGTLGQPFEVQTNYLDLNLDKMPDVAYHYDVVVDPDRPKKFMRPAIEEYRKKYIPKYAIAYDGRANAYSVSLLPTEFLEIPLEVEVKDGNRMKEFKVTLKATQDTKVDLKSLKTYRTERIYDKPMRALQCLEVVLGEPCHQAGTRAGRSFFVPPDRRIDVGGGYELWFGLFQAAMLCDKPFLNVDVSHKSFPSTVDIVWFADNCRHHTELPNFFSGLSVAYTPPPSFGAPTKIYKYNAIMSSSRVQTFKTEDGKQWTVESYFKSKGVQLKRPDLPCIHVGNKEKNIYLPLEFISIPPGQAIMRKDDESQVRKIIREAATSTDIRKRKIMDLLRHFKHNAHPMVSRFGISIGNNFITVQARLLSSPSIQYNRTQVRMEKPGQWNFRNTGFFQIGSEMTHEFAIINLAQRREITALTLKQFGQNVVRTAEPLGMRLSSTSHIFELRMDQRRPTIKPKLEDLKRQKISFVFVILPREPYAYAVVKQEAELSCGIVTQCLKNETFLRMNPMTLTNILMKVNVKLNGVNHKIADGNAIALQKQRKRIMFVGADVSHPSPLQKNTPSVVGVVASHDLDGTKYNMQYTLQNPGKEEILNMNTIFAKHLAKYKQHTGTYPEHIIYYRDGVSDAQFKSIQSIELRNMREACRVAKCNPLFTCIVVVKRHHTRFFPEPKLGDGGKFNNVKAGTVVDRTIIHPNETEFFLVSHISIQGTAKPTRYNVILDDAHIHIDDLQALTYNLCSTFQRCSRTVSYPAPAYYAHLVGARAKAYIEGKKISLDKLKREEESRAICPNIIDGNPMFFV